MDEEQARLLLGACQPSGADRDRPEVAAAFRQAQRDPELAEWLAREQRSDAAIARKLRELEPPAGLRSSLLAGGRASRAAASRRRSRLPLGLAASLLLVAGLVWWMIPSRSLYSSGPPLSLANWQEACVRIFRSPFFLLDMTNDDYPPLEAHLAAQGAPVAGQLPFTASIVSALGCKVLDWRGAMVSLACFNDASGEVVHLFVMKRGLLDETSLLAGPRRKQIGSFATVTWLQENHLIMVTSRLGAAELERVLALDSSLLTAQLGVHVDRSPRSELKKSFPGRKPT